MRTRPEESRWIIRRALGIVLAVLFTRLAGQAQGVTYHADAELGDNAFDGLSNVVANGHGPKRTVVNAIATASSGDLLVMAAGSYGQEYRWDLGAKDLTLRPQNQVTVGNIDLGEADTDGDGIPDWWMLNYFDTIMATGSTACASCDPDRDGVVNSDEYSTGTNPLDSNSSPMVAPPIFSQDGGTFTNVQDVVVSCTITGATIHYTVNGQNPTTNDLVVASGEAVRIAGTKWLKARAWVSGMTPSGVKSAAFTTPFPWAYTNLTSLFTLPESDHCLFFPGETITVSNSNFTSYEVYDLRTNRVAFVPKGTPTNLVNLAAGHYFIESSKDIKEFAVVPRACAGAGFAGAETPSGMNNFAWQSISRFRPQLWRTGGFMWKYAEPVDGVYAWSISNDLRHSLDDQVDAALAAGASKVIAGATVRPTWMQGTNNDAVFISKYTAFCTALAQHLIDKYGGRVGLGIEVWNEPHYSSDPFDDGALPFVYDCAPSTVMSRYFGVLTNAYNAIKAVSTNIEVVGAAFTSPPMDMLYTNFVAMGGLNYMDSLGVTYKRWTAYESSQVISDACYCCGTREVYAWMEDDFDTLCRKWIAEIQGKPLYLYESALYGHSILGIPYYYFGSAEKADHGVTWWQGYTRAQKQVIMGRAAGVSMLLNHVLLNGMDGEPTRPTTFAWELDGWEYSPTVVFGHRGPCPKTSAWLAAIAQVNGGTTFTNVHDSTRWVYAWANPTNTSVAAWTIEGSTATSVSFAVTDVYGNTRPSVVGEEPMYWTTTATPSDAAVAGFVAIGGTCGVTINSNVTRTANFDAPPVISVVSIATSSPTITNDLVADVTAICDADGNGINDDWEVQYYGHIGVDPNADTDGDGFTNLQEFLAGTDPTKAASALRINGVTRLDWGGFNLRWPSVPMKTYKVLYSESPGGPWHEDLPDSQLTAGTGETALSYTDGSASGVAQRFYRVRLVP